MQKALCSISGNLPPANVACGVGGWLFSDVALVGRKVRLLTCLRKNVFLFLLSLFLFASDCYSTTACCSAHRPCTINIAGVCSFYGIGRYVQANYQVQASYNQIYIFFNHNTADGLSNLWDGGCYVSYDPHPNDMFRWESIFFSGSGGVYSDQFNTSTTDVNCPSGSGFYPSNVVIGGGIRTNDFCDEWGCGACFSHDVIACLTIIPEAEVVVLCSEPLLINAPACQGGKGMFFLGSNSSVSLAASGLFGYLTYNTGNTYFFGERDVVGYSNLVGTQSTNFQDYTRPDGSQCTNNTEGNIFTLIVCPFGFASNYSSASNNSSGSQSSASEPSSNSQPSSSSACKIIIDGVCMDRNDDCHVKINGVCMDNKDSLQNNCRIMIDGVCVQYISSSAGGGSSGSGDWAKEDIQILEYKTALASKGVLDSILEAIKNLAKSIVDGIANLFGLGSNNGSSSGSGGGGSASSNSGGNASSNSGGGGSSGSGGGGSAGSAGSGGGGSSGSIPCPGYEFQCNNAGWPSGTCDPRVSDCSSEGDGDTIVGITRYGVDSILRHLGSDTASVRQKYSYTQLLADTTKVFPHTRKAVTPFTNYIGRQSNGCSAFIDFNFDFGGGFKCTTCRIDLTTFGGQPINSIISSIFTIAFGLGVLIRLLYVVRTIGNSGA